jgi:chromosome segregation ATPase
MHNQSEKVLNHRLQQQAEEYHEVIDAKDSHIEDMSGLVDAQAAHDHEKLEAYAKDLQGRRDRANAEVALLHQEKAALDMELKMAETTHEDVRPIRKKIHDLTPQLQKAEAELHDLTILLAASEDIIVRDKENIRDKEKLAELEASTRNAWMFTTVLFLTLSVGAGAQLYVSRSKFKKFVDDADYGPGANEVGTRA